MRKTSAALRKPSTSPAFPDRLDRLIPRQEGYRLLGISRATGLRRERAEPGFPQPVALNSAADRNHIRYAFKESELRAYLEALPRRETGAATATSTTRKEAATATSPEREVA